MLTPKRANTHDLVRELKRARGEGDRSEIARLAEALGDDSLRSGRPGDAAIHFGAALEEGRFRLPTDRARVRIKQARCLYEQDRCREALGILEDTLSLLQRSPDDNLAANALGLAADVCLRGGQVRRAYRYAVQARGLSARRGVGPDALRIKLSLGAVFARLGRWEEAGALFEDVLSAARRGGEAEPMGRALNNLGVVHKNRCEWGRAIDCFEQAIRLARRKGGGRPLAERLNNLGIVHYKTGDWRRAVGAWREALRTARRAKDRRSEASVLLGLGRLAVAKGELRKAERWYSAALGLSEKDQDLRTQTLVHEFVAEMALEAGDLDAAAEALQRATALAEKVGRLTDLSAEIRRVQAEVVDRRGSPARALRLVSQGLDAARRTGDRYEEARLLALRARIRAHQGNPRAGVRFQQAIERLSDLGMRHLLARTLVGFAGWMIAAERSTAARDRVQECLIVASEIFERLGDVRGLAEAQIALAGWKLKQGGVEGALSILRGLEDLEPPAEPLRDKLVGLRGELEEFLVGRIDGRTMPYPGLIESPVETPGDLPSAGDLLEKLAAAVGADRALWVRQSRAGSDPRVVGSTGFEADAARELARWMFSPQRAWKEDGRPVLSVCPAGDPRFSRFASVRRARSILLLPVSAGDPAQGVVYLDRAQARGLPFGGREMEKLPPFQTALEALSQMEAAVPGEGIRVTTPSGVKVIPFMYGGRKLANVLGVVARVCDSNVPVLIQGETGTGKELVARALHHMGGRRARPFVAQNCAAIPRELLESELFGYVSGAFTGAVSSKAGLFEVAEGGTFFLDEVSEVDAPSQVKLLRFLETGEVRRLGSVDARTVDVRIVSATNCILPREVERGRFREDLYYRLNVVSVELPPLRERPEDVPLLAVEFLRRAFAEEGKRPGRLSDAALDMLLAHHWPGNVREIQNEMKRVAALSPGGTRIQPNLLSPRIRFGDREPGPARLDRDLRSIERTRILEALEAERWNLSRAARALGGMPRSTLASKVKRLGIRRI